MQKVTAAGEPAASHDAARTTLRRCRPIPEALVLLWVCCIGQADGGLHGDRTAADSLAAEASTGVPFALPSAAISPPSSTPPQRHPRRDSLPRPQPCPNSDPTSHKNFNNISYVWCWESD